jgi:hypothetical protein
VATTPHHENAVGSYPDDPHNGTAPTTKRAGAKTVDRKRCEIPMRIVRIDTIPMTAKDRDNAAEALAVLLNHFWRAHPDLAA